MDNMAAVRSAAIDGYLRILDQIESEEIALEKTLAQLSHNVEYRGAKTRAQPGA
jgi:hypothetical protein